MSLKIECRKSYESLYDNEKQIIIESLCDLYDLDRIVVNMFVVKLFEFHYQINILKQNDIVVAFCIYKPDYRSHIGAIYHVDTLYVIEKNQGYGTELLNVFKGSTIQLECKACNKSAQAFYDKFGLKKRAYSYMS